MSGPSSRPSWPPRRSAREGMAGFRVAVRPNTQMQPTGRNCPALRAGAASREDAAERRLVRARARSPAADLHSVRPLHGDRSEIHDTRRPESRTGHEATPEALHGARPAYASARRPVTAAAVRSGQRRGRALRHCKAGPRAAATGRGGSRRRRSRLQYGGAGATAGARCDDLHSERLSLDGCLVSEHSPGHTPASRRALREGISAGSGLTRKCSRQAGVGRRAGRARRS